MQPPEFETQLRTLTMLWGGLAAGPLIFLGVALQQVASGAVEPLPPDQALPILVLAGVFSVVGPLLSQLVPPRLATSARATNPDPLAIARITMIVGASLAESSALIAVVAYLVTAQAYVLGALGPPYLALLILRPTREKLQEVVREAERTGPQR